MFMRFRDFAPAFAPAFVPAFALTLAVSLAGTVAPALAQQTGPQPTLPKQPMTIVGDDGKSHAFQVEMALTPDQQETGLMFRTSVAPDSGMLFVFSAPQEGQFWMKNTLVPLDMVFINADGTIRTILENTVPHSLAIDDSNGPVLAVLELQGGLTAKEDIAVGDKVIAKPFGNTK
jgi:uncharacterized membrane protein (UPF0127 family)